LKVGLMVLDSHHCPVQRGMWSECSLDSNLGVDRFHQNWKM
jgi:hypothetical protein